MVATTAVAVRGGRGGLAPALWHLAGLVVGAVALGLAVSGLGRALGPFPDVAVAVVAAAAAVAGGLAVAGARSPVLSSPAQVPKAWSRTMTPAQSSFLYGVGLGLAVLTRIPSWSLHLALAALFLAGSPVLGAAAGLGYALARSAPVVGAALAGRRAEDVVAVLDGWRSTALRVDGAAMVAVAVALAVVALG